MTLDCHSFSLSSALVGGMAYGAALGHLYTSHLRDESSLQAALAECASQQRLWLRQRRQRSRQRTGQTSVFPLYKRLQNGSDIRGVAAEGAAHSCEALTMLTYALRRCSNKHI